MANILFDKFSREIKVGDILAESEVDKVIWGGVGKVVKRPIGMMTEHGLIQLRPGLVIRILEDPNNWIATRLLASGQCHLSFTTKPDMAVGSVGEYVSNNMEVLMNIDDLS